MLDWCNHDERSETHCYSEHTSDREKERCTKLHMGYDEQMGCWVWDKEKSDDDGKTNRAEDGESDDYIIERCQKMSKHKEIESNQKIKRPVPRLDKTLADYRCMVILCSYALQQLVNGTSMKRQELHILFR
jgi:hypothetical protein